jgi:adenosylcobalamin-dependent ribonucleoside-triphosphate reductase
MHVKIREAFQRDHARAKSNDKTGVPVSITLIVDVMNLIGKCVISGNVRRSSEIAFGPADSFEFLQLKNYEKNPERQEFGWASNNSVLADVGMDYSKLVSSICDNGEPGIQWLSNMKQYSRMGDKPTFKDTKVVGSNPCGEMGLESYELCNLVEIFPTRCVDDKGQVSLVEFLRTIKFAYLYAKTVSLCKTHWPETNAVLLRNRRIGCSISGIAQFEALYGIDTLRTWLIKGYDEIQKWDKIYSDWLCVPRSIKTTTVKPSGSISLLAGVTPGLHFPISQFYTRRVRVGNNDPLLAILKEAGHKIEPCFGNEKTTSVVEFPIDCGKGVRPQSQVSMWEQVNLAQFMQKYWSDNQVSITVTFNKSEAKDLIHILKYAQYNLKSVSFLPSIDGDCKYPQLPYEPITEDKYKQDCLALQSIRYDKLNEKSSDAPRHNFCDGDTCVL